MTATEFFVLLQAHAKGALITAMTLPNISEVDVFHGKIVPSSPIPLTKFRGNRNLDMVNAANGLYLFSNKIFNILEENQITGWNSLPVEIHMGKGEINHDYRLLTVTGRLVKIDFEKSEQILKQPFSPSGKPIWIKRGLPIDMHTWDGSDIFSAENTLFTFISEKVRNLLVENRCTNIRIEETTELELY